jgi:hypothetical protein
MRRGYQIAKWSRRAETLHRKAQELAEDIEAADGEFGDLSAEAHEVATSAMQLANSLERGKPHQ